MKNLSLPTIYVFDIFSHRGAIVKNRQQNLIKIRILSNDHIFYY